MKPKISVILPVYNAEKYLSATLDSVLSSSFSDFEIVAANDGSTDSSLSILKEYAERDARIKIIDKQNTGVSDTRNTAIEAAEGEYLAFLDSDDIYSPNYLERMYSAACDCGADVTVCSYLTFRGDVPAFTTSDKPAELTTVKELLDTGLMTSMCVKLMKKSIVVENGIKFDTELAFGEDLFFSWRVCLAADKTVRISDVLYGYRMTSEGATMRYHDRLYEKYKCAFDELKAYANERDLDESTISEIDIYFVKRLPTLTFMCARSKRSLCKKLRNISNILSDAVISDITENHLDELTAGEGKGTIALYNNARKKKTFAVFTYGLKMELRLQLSRLKRRIEERKSDRK